MNPIEKALTRLDHGRRWHKGWFDGPNESVCMIGALRGITTSFNMVKAFRTIEDVLLEQYPDRVEGRMAYIPNFNDHPDTVWADVERVLEKAEQKWNEQV